MIFAMRFSETPHLHLRRRNGFSLAPLFLKGRGEIPSLALKIIFTSGMAAATAYDSVMQSSIFPSPLVGEGSKTSFSSFLRRG